MTNEHWPWLIAGIMSILTAIVLIGNAADRIAKTWKAIKAPNEELRKEMDDMKDWRKDLEEDGPMKEWRKSVDKSISEASGSVRSFQESNHVMFQAMLALLDHGIDGNNISQMEAAKTAVQNYLIDK